MLPYTHSFYFILLFSYRIYPHILGASVVVAALSKCLVSTQEVCKYYLRSGHFLPDIKKKLECAHKILPVSVLNAFSSLLKHIAESL